MGMDGNLIKYFFCSGGVFVVAKRWGKDASSKQCLPNMYEKHIWIVLWILCILIVHQNVYQIICLEIRPDIL